MSLFGKVFISGVFFIIVPLVIGNGFLSYLQMKPNVFLGYVYGWIVMLASYEVIAVPAVFLRCSLSVLSLIYSAILICFLVITVVYLYKQHYLKRLKNNILQKVFILNPYIIISMILVLTQLAIALVGMHTDSDDAYYVGTATTSVATDTLYMYEPDNGLLYTYIPTRYIFSALMVFWAYISIITGIHPLGITHTIVPVLFIGMSYIIWWNIGTLLLKKAEHRSLFFLFMNIFNIFGFTSVYTQSAFLLFRIWQGKAMIPNIIFPVMLYLFLYMLKVKNRGNKRLWSLVFCTVVAGCCCSSLAVPLCMLVVGCGTLILMWFEKKRNLMIPGIICCLPCLIIGVAFLVIK